MDHTNSTVLNSVDFVPETLIDAVVYGAADEKIGKVSHVHGMGTASMVVVDAGGFLGLGTRAVLLPAKDLIFRRDEDGRVHAMTTWTKDQVMAMPEHMDH